MQRELGGFGHWPHEHQQAQQQSCPWGNAAIAQSLLQPIGDPLEIETSRGPEQAKNAQQEAKVADTVNHKRFLRGMSCTVAVVPKANKQVGAHPHQFPEHINFQEVWTDNQSQHRAAEECQVREKAHVSFVVGHVPVRVDHHQHSDGGHQRQHHRCQRIHHITHRQAEGSRASPNKQMLNRWCTGQLTGQDRVTQHSGCTDAGDQQQSNRLA